MKEPKILLEHILESVSYIQDFIADSSYEDFVKMLKSKMRFKEDLRSLERLLKIYLMN